jgi:tetratricopeptide (TPR) repeat protein
MVGSSFSFPMMAFLLLAALTCSIGAVRPLTAQQSESQHADPMKEVSTLVVQARAQIAAGEIEAAQEMLSRAISISPNSPEANLLFGELLLDRHRYPEAMERFETVLATDRRSVKARQGELSASLALALDARRAGNQEAALLCLRHANESLPDDPTLLHALGIQLYDMNQLVDANEVLLKAIALAPEQPENLYAVARVEVDRQLFPVAEQHFKNYLVVRPNDASAHYGYGHLLQMQQRIEEATLQFNKSIELQPQQTESYYQLGQMALDMHHDQEARTLFQRTLTRAPNHGGALTGLGIIAFREKDYAAAAGSLRKAVLASPDYQPAHYYLGLALGRLNDKDGSAQELKLAIELASKQQGKGNPLPVEAKP